MRIIAGTGRGRTLKAPGWPGLRPTSDRLRETLFNILAPRVRDARVLDAFAGTGAVALEAISRGAASAVCLEQDRRAQALIAENRDRLAAGSRCMIRHVDARRALRAPIAGGPFDIVFLDPPYAVDDLETLVASAASQRAEGGILVLEHASRREPPALEGRPPDRSVKAGDSTLSFYL
jgi:16S rRNA (guanine(966)-N(2))-methyltransferase RsmD